MKRSGVRALLLHSVAYLLLFGSGCEQGDQGERAARVLQPVEEAGTLQIAPSLIGLRLHDTAATANRVLHIVVTDHDTTQRDVFHLTVGLQDTTVVESNVSESTALSFSPRLLLSPLGELYVFWQEYADASVRNHGDGFGVDMYYRAWQPESGEWTPKQKIYTVPRARRAVRVSYTFASPSRLFVAVSHGQLTNILEVDLHQGGEGGLVASQEGVYSSIAFDAEAQVLHHVFVGNHARRGESRGEVYYRYMQDDVWSIPVLIRSNLEKRPHFTSLGLRADNVPVLIWYEEPGRDHLPSQAYIATRTSAEEWQVERVFESPSGHLIGVPRFRDQGQQFRIQSRYKVGAQWIFETYYVNMCEDATSAAAVHEGGRVTLSRLYSHALGATGVQVWIDQDQRLLVKQAAFAPTACAYAAGNVL